MADRQDTIRRIYREHRDRKPFRALWRWARAGDTRRERYNRWKALQRWAQGHRDNSSGDERERWNGRRKIYRKQKRKVLRRIRDTRGDDSDLGTGPWGGSQSIIEAVVLSEYSEHGIYTTSRKRWETFGNPSSDHYMGNTTAYAADGAIATAYWLHAQIADSFRAHGLPLDATPSDYASRYCSNGNGRWRFQGIASTHGTGPHYHAGCRRA